MDPTGETLSNQSDFVAVELYAGPLDGEEYLLPRPLLTHISELAIIRPCNRLMLETLNAPSLHAACEHIYTRHHTLSLRFHFRSTTLAS